MKRQQAHRPTRLEAARERVTPLRPRLLLFCSGEFTTVLSDVGFGAGYFGGQAVYGGFDDPLLAPDGVRVWLAQGSHRLYAAAMPDYARAERELLQGRRRFHADGGQAHYTVSDEAWALTVTAAAKNGGERRQLTLRNISGSPRTVSLCAAVTPTFTGATVRYPDGIAIHGDTARLALWAAPAGADCLLTGGRRLRVRFRITLPPGAQWEGTFWLTGGEIPLNSTPPVRLLEPWLPPEAEQLGRRLLPQTATAAFIRAAEAAAAEPPAELPKTPYFHLGIPNERRLPVLREALRRIDRWTHEGIPTGLWITAPPSMQPQIARLCRRFPAVPHIVTEKELPLLRALSCGDIGERERRLRIAVPFAPLPLTALPGESLRRPRLSLPVPGVLPGSLQLVWQNGDRLFSLLGAHAGQTYALPAAGGEIALTVRQTAAPGSCRFTVSLLCRTRSPVNTALTLYAEPQLHTPQDRALTASLWEPESGTLQLIHPFAPQQPLWLSGGAGAIYTCERVAFLTAKHGNRVACPLPSPAAAVTRELPLLPGQETTAVFGIGWTEPPTGAFV